MDILQIYRQYMYFLLIYVEFLFYLYQVELYVNFFVVFIYCYVGFVMWIMIVIFNIVKLVYQD